MTAPVVGAFAKSKVLVVTALLLLVLATAGCTTLEELTENNSSNGSVDATAIPTTLPENSTPTLEQEFQSLVLELNAKGLITQELVEDVFAKKARLESIDPEVNDPEVAMQILTEFNDAFQAWGGNVTEVLALSEDLVGEIGPQGRAGLHSPLAAGCFDVIALNKTMDKVQKDTDETKAAQEEFFEVNYKKDFDKMESAKKKYVSSYANTTNNVGNEIIKGPPATAAGVFMAGATAVVIGVVGGTAAVVSAPAILTITAVGVGTTVAVNWLWDLLTPQPKGSIDQGTPLAAPLSAGESCQFVSNSSENSQPSIFSDTGGGNLHIFMEDRAPLVLENFSINSGEQVTLTVEPPALDGVTTEELADAIEGADIAVEDMDPDPELEPSLEPEPTLKPTILPTDVPPTEVPSSEQDSDTITNEEALAALTQFANNEGWRAPTGSGTPGGHFLYVLKEFNQNLTTLSQYCINTDCNLETGQPGISIGATRNQIETGEIVFTINRRSNNSCSISGIWNVAYRGTLIQISYLVRSFLGEIRENGVVVTREDSCADYGTDHVESEIRRIKQHIINLLPP